jgi:hypothetical protein
MHFSKSRELKEKGREHSTLLLTIIVGHTDTRWQKVTQVRVATIPRAGTSVRLPRITTWEEAKPTRNYV